MKNIFNSVQFSRPQKNKFDLSHERKMSLKMGDIVPFLVQEVIPGDNFNVGTEMFLRMQPMLAPIFHRLRVKTDYFFVPNRLVWDDWQKFITGGEDGMDVSVHPYILQNDANRTNFVKGTLYDYMGLPVTDGTPWIGGIDLKINALPFRAYSLIYNEYYRDQNLIPELIISKTGGQVQAGEYDQIVHMRQRAWEKDYFTSCLPEAQKGGAVNVPGQPVYKQAIAKKNSDGTTDAAAGAVTIGAGGQMQDSVPSTIQIQNIDEVNIPVNDLRISVRLQEWLEKNARAGSRYIESILAHFGVLSSDARLQRPEYLGGSTAPIVISEVVSTFQFSGDAEGQPQGHMAGHGVGTGGYGGFKRKFEEHGWVFGLMTVLPKTAYQQGVHKSFSRFDKLDYAWPTFAQLGEQAVAGQELYFDTSNSVNNTNTFGYQSRYAEYKYIPSTVHGDFRDTLSYWHMGRIFTASPLLNQSFITADPTKRIFAVTLQEEDEVLCQLYNKVSAIRALPYFNNPTL